MSTDRERVAVPASPTETQLGKVRAYLCRLAKAVTKTPRSKFSYQVVRRDREDGTIEYQIFADTKHGTQIAWVQSTHHDADFIAACLAQAPLFEELLRAEPPPVPPATAPEWQFFSNRLAALEAALQTVREQRDEYKTLAKVGPWHNDCRPNRHMAARELQKSQAVIDKLADRISELEAKLQTAEQARDALQATLTQIRAWRAAIPAFVSSDTMARIWADLDRLLAAPP